MRSKQPTFDFCVHPQHFSTKPTNNPIPDTEIWGKPDTEILKIARTIASHQKSISYNELKTAILNGQSISPYQHSIPIGWDRPRRKEEFFLSMSAVILDFDNGTDVKDLISTLQTINIDFSLIHKSFSHTPSHPKYRGIILLKTPITDPILAKALNLYFSNLFFSSSDSSCTDLSRIFFGGGKESIVYTSNYIMDSSVYHLLCQEFEHTVKVRNPRHSYSGEYNLDLTISHDLSHMQEIFSQIPKDTRDLLVFKINKELDMLEKYNGSYSNRYMNLWNTSRALAQVPVLPGELVYEWVLEAVEKNKYYKDYDKDVKTIIESGIVYGKDNESYEIEI